MAKEKGRNRVQLCHADDADLSSRKGEMEWVGRIRNALDQDRFACMHKTLSPLPGPTSRVNMSSCWSACSTRTANSSPRQSTPSVHVSSALAVQCATSSSPTTQVDCPVPGVPRPGVPKRGLKLGSIGKSFVIAAGVFCLRNCCELTKWGIRRRPRLPMLQLL